MEIITLVNEQNEVIGFEEKIAVHQKGLLHQAFSVLIYNDEGQMLIHKRALNKYHSAGLWTNACCGHPRKGEKIEDAAERRLQEEMGFASKLTLEFIFHYYVSFENDLIENEIDHVFKGKFNGNFDVNKEEVMDYKWVSIDDLKKEVNEFPQNFTYWFKEILAQL